MIDILQIVKDHLDASPEVILPTKIGFICDTPSDVICVYYLDGDNPNNFFGSSNLKHIISKPRVRVRVRSVNYLTAWQTAESVKATLRNFQYEDVMGMFLDGDILPLGQDENKRTEFEINFRTIVNE